MWFTTAPRFKTKCIKRAVFFVQLSIFRFSHPRAKGKRHLPSVPIRNELSIYQTLCFPLKNCLKTHQKFFWEPSKKFSIFFPRRIKRPFLLKFIPFFVFSSLFLQFYHLYTSRLHKRQSFSRPAPFPTLKRQWIAPSPHQLLRCKIWFSNKKRANPPSRSKRLHQNGISCRTIFDFIATTRKI